MMGSGQKNDDELTEEETARRLDAALLLALSTPHKKQTAIPKCVSHSSPAGCSNADIISDMATVCPCCYP
jgi:hypothetical protein